MVICLYGPDAYRRAKKLREITDAYARKHSFFSVRSFFLSNSQELDQFRVFIENQSLLDTGKLAIMYDIEDAPLSANLIKDCVQEKNLTLVIVTEKKPSKAFAFLLKEPVVAQSFDLLKETELYTFIKNEARARDVNITPDTLRYLSETFSSDTWGIITELEKLSLGGTMHAPVYAPPFFPLIQALKNPRDPKSRLVALSYLLETEDPAAVFNITASIADAKLKVKMADLDVAVKSGKLDYEEALTEVALSS